MTKLVPLVFLLVLVLCVQYAELLRCWVCSSDLTPICGESISLDSTKPGYDSTGRMGLGDCNFYIVQQFDPDRKKTVCRKTKINYHGHLFITRACMLTNEGGNSTHCPLTSSDNPELEVTSCEICDTDGCNN